MHCVHVTRKGFCKSKMLRAEFNRFANECEIRGITVASKYVNTHRNFIADLGTRGQPLLAACLNQALRENKRHGPRKSTMMHLDNQIYGEALLESIGVWTHQKPTSAPLQYILVCHNLLYFCVAKNYSPALKTLGVNNVPNCGWEK